MSGRHQSCFMLACHMFHQEFGSTYAFRNPKVQKRHDREPTTHSQPCKPSSGGIAGVLSFCSGPFSPVASSSDLSKPEVNSGMVLLEPPLSDTGLDPGVSEGLG